MLEEQLAQLRTPLLRFARQQLRDEALAEDAVSETFLAILERPDGFGGQSSLQTYATGILKHKLIDQLRKRGRETQIEVDDDAAIDEAIDRLFQQDGHWVEPPPAWVNPERSLEQRQFFETLQGCIDRLPPRLSRIFMLREWMELEVEAICRELGVSESNCGVMLYRARMQLRECLSLRWFQQKEAA